MKVYYLNFFEFIIIDGVFIVYILIIINFKFNFFNSNINRKTNCYKYNTR
jgi:hypothetical protein